MNTHADKTQENKSQSVSNAESQKQSGGESTFQFVENRPEAIAQRKLQEMANNSPQTIQLKAFQEMANNNPQAKQTVQLQATVDRNSEPVLQLKPYLDKISGKWKNNDIRVPGTWETEAEAQEAEDLVTLAKRPATARAAGYAAKQQNSGPFGQYVNDKVEGAKRIFGFGIPEESQKAGNALGRLQSDFEEEARQDNPAYKTDMERADKAGKFSTAAGLASTAASVVLPPIKPAVKGAQAGAKVVEGMLERQAATKLEGSRPQSAYGRGNARAKVVRTSGKRKLAEGAATTAEALPLVGSAVGKAGMYAYDRQNKKEVDDANVDFSEKVRREKLKLPPIK